MIKKGKYFIEPSKDGSSFQELFDRLVSAGAGRPVDRDGFPSGPWTPDLLADAITSLPGNEKGIELRTVQNWFQHNDRGISAENLRWLARIFGCGDPVASVEWQVALSGALNIQKQRRKKGKEAVVKPQAVPAPVDPPPIIEPPIVTELDDTEANTQIVEPPSAPISKNRPRFWLARLSEAIFSSGSPLDLPSAIFAGATALGFLSYILGLHNVTYERADGIIKQVGYLWSPNWTVLFMACLPIYCLFVAEAVKYWRREARSQIERYGGTTGAKSWLQQVEATSLTFWSVFLICIVFAGVIQWVGVRLGPLLNGGDEYAADWGSLPNLRPDVTSVPESILFTGLTYLYMSLTFYVLFSGLILLYLLVHDYGDLGGGSIEEKCKKTTADGRRVDRTLMNSVFRCTILVFHICITMKLQSLYLVSDGSSIVQWLVDDLLLFFAARELEQNWIAVSMPNHFTSLVVLIGAMVVFVFASSRLKVLQKDKLAFSRMMLILGTLSIGYLFMGHFTGFSLVLVLGTLLSVYALFDPEFNFVRQRQLRERQSV